MTAIPLRRTGLGAAPGRANGKVHLLHEASLRQVVPGEAILVTRILHPHFAPMLARVAGIIVEEGSLLQHATTLAREFGIPAIVGVSGAVAEFRDGDDIEIDGSTGEILVRQVSS